MAPRVLLSAPLFFSLILFLTPPAWGEALVGQCAFNLTKREWIIRKGDSLGLKPASVQKIFIASAALKALGPEHRFETILAFDRSSRGRIHNLYLIGGGDPSLSTEDIYVLARSVKLAKFSEVGQITFDDSLFEDNSTLKGERAYQTGTSGLAVNYNSVAVTGCLSGESSAVVGIDPWESGIEGSGTIHVDDGSSSLNIQSSPKTGKYLATGSISRGSGCVRRYRSNPSPAQTAGAILKEALTNFGIKVRGNLVHGIAPSRYNVIDIRSSEPLRNIVWGMNNFSTNVIADQLLLSLGRREESGASLKLALSRVKELLPELGDAVLVDGSGLSHSNRVSPRSICELLIKQDSDWGIASEIASSLAISGRSGTLKTRSFGLPKGVVRGKTGTIDGVSSLAGYMVTRSGEKVAFATIMNGDSSKDEALSVEDRFVRALYEGRD